MSVTAAAAAVAGGVSVLFSASQRGSAGLPDWLVLQQQEEAPLSHAFLYGTPPSSSSSTTRQLEIEVRVCVCVRCWRYPFFCC